MPAISGSKRLILGREHDEALRAGIIAVLRRLRARTRASSWDIGGSHEVGTYRFVVDGEDIAITSQTDAGLAIEGPGALVDRIHAELDTILSVDETSDSGRG